MLLRNPLQKRGHQVALGVDDAHTAPGLDVVKCEIEQQGALPGAGGSEDVDVMAGVSSVESCWGLAAVLEKAEDLALVARTARGGEARRGSVEASHGGWERERAGQLTGDQDHPAGWRHSPGGRAIDTSARA